MRQDLIRRLLPDVIDRTCSDRSTLAGLLFVMERLHASTESALDDLDALVDPMRSRASFVPFLTRWVGLDWLLRVDLNNPLSGMHQTLPSGIGHLREVVAQAAGLAKWSGTGTGLVHLLELASGLTGYEVVEGLDGEGRSRAFHLLVRAPREAEPYAEMVRRIVSIEKPAYLTAEVRFDGSHPARST